MDNTDDVVDMVARLVQAGKPLELAREAVDTLGPDASWEELITYGEDGEPEVQAELTKFMARFKKTLGYLAK